MLTSCESSRPCWHWYGIDSAGTEWLASFVERVAIRYEEIVNRQGEEWQSGV